MGGGGAGAGTSTQGLVHNHSTGKSAKRQRSMGEMVSASQKKTELMVT